MLSGGPEIVNALVTFKNQKKFIEDDSLLYPGAPDEVTRANAEIIVNGALTELIALSEKGLSEEKFWTILRSATLQLSKMDSEEVDRGLTYMEDIMDIYGIESSEGRLNEWRYNFDPNK